MMILLILKIKFQSSKKYHEKKYKKNKKISENQKSFYFEDYLETNQNKKKFENTSISQDRIYILFFFFFCLITIFSIKIQLVSFKKLEILNFSQ